MNNLQQFSLQTFALCFCWIIFISPIQQDTTKKVKYKRVYECHLDRQIKELKTMNNNLDSLLLVLKIDTTKMR